MPIIESKQGDLLSASEPFIAHGVNCLGVMGAGVARAIAEKWPSSELKYKEFCYKYGTNPEKLLGLSLATSEKEAEKVLFHLFTQPDVGLTERKVHYGALARAFSEMNNSLEYMRQFDEHMERETLRDPTITIPAPVVAIPKVGAGLGGGDWELIAELINGTTPNINIVVYEK